VHFVAAEPIKGVVALALASEPWSPTEPERDRGCQAVREAAATGAPMIVGIDGATAVASDLAVASDVDLVLQDASQVEIRPVQAVLGARSAGVNASSHAVEPGDHHMVSHAPG
jgi:hypothetical protein